MAFDSTEQVDMTDMNHEETHHDAESILLEIDVSGESVSELRNEIINLYAQLAELKASLALKEKKGRELHKMRQELAMELWEGSMKNLEDTMDWYDLKYIENPLCLLSLANARQEDILSDLTALSKQVEGNLENFFDCVKDLDIEGDLKCENQDYEGAAICYGKGIEIFINFPIVFEQAGLLACEMLKCFYDKIKVIYKKEARFGFAYIAERNSLRIKSYICLYEISHLGPEDAPALLQYSPFFHDITNEELGLRAEYEEFYLDGEDTRDEFIRNCLQEN